MHNNVEIYEGIRVAILADSPIMQQGLIQVLNSSKNINYLFSCSTGSELFASLILERSDILLLDLGLIGMSGFEVLKASKKKYPKIKVLVYSSAIDDLTIQRLLMLRSDGYITQQCAPEQLLAAIQAVYAGQSYFPEKFNAFKKAIDSAPKLMKAEELTKREQQVLRLICKDRSTKEIAAELFISVNTVNNHRKNISTKTKQTSLVGLLNFGLLNGYMD